jgi:acyl-CoA synthetase (AMP-forming)/AMP-acid ligase II
VLAASKVAPGAVTALEADFSPQSVAMLLALARRGCQLVPLSPAVETKKSEFLSTAEVEQVVTVDAQDRVSVRATGVSAKHTLYARLREAGAPGLVLFSSGSTGASKAVLHDLGTLLAKFEVRRHARRMVGFLLFDHIGGVNTLLYALSNGGCLIVPSNRSPDAVLGAIARHRGEVLPTSPTFLNLVLISEAYRRHDLSSLRLVTYGTEPMPESTLKRIHSLLPHAELQQTYGLSEIGILRSKSRASDSLWIRIGGEGFETRVVDGLLEVKARSAMLGYLNAPSPFTEDGWLRTGDAVETDGDYFRILGRRSELINVGGEKVFPQEVEAVILELPEVAEATVWGAPNPITGQIVCARVRPRGANLDVKTIRAHCAARLERYKVPLKIELVDTPLHGSRFKKLRA